MKLISGKVEVIYLLTKVIEKYEKEVGSSLIKNSNRRNYEPIAKVLSVISNQLPYTAESLEHEPYSIDYNPHNQEYPFRKYDITGNQIKDAFYHQIISNPRPFLIDACYIYLYGKGRKGFEANPTDEGLIESKPSNSKKHSNENTKQRLIKSNKVLLILALICLTGFLVTLYQFISLKEQSNEVKNDMKIMPYKPTKAEVDSLEGIWIAYIGSPQARLSDLNRYHLVAQNILDIHYKNGYFVFTRYGVSFNHEGYAQFESPYLVSLHSFVKNKQGQIESPRHTLMPLDKETKYNSVISTSWNFDVGNKNAIIGIREVFVKQGKGGSVEEVMNTVENASCKCKIVRWQREKSKIQDFQLKNVLLETLPERELQELINEKSILLRTPQDGLLLSQRL